jgi:hypothetical protein
LELDSRQDEERLNNPKAVSSFEVRTGVECRFIRIRATGSDWPGSSRLACRAFDLFFGICESPIPSDSSDLAIPE